MKFDAIARSLTLKKLCPNRKYLWKGDLWGGLEFQDELGGINYDTFLTEYNTQLETLTRKRKIQDVENVVQKMLDSEAKALGYDSIATAVTYAEEPSVEKFQTEGKALRKRRSEVWGKCYEILAAVDAGEREEPTVDQLISELKF